MMNWECKEFKITKYENEEDYKNNKISSIESHHKNLVTNRGLLSLWILATNNQIEVVDPADSSKKLNPVPFATDKSKIAIGSGTGTASANDKALSNQVALLSLASSTGISIQIDNDVAQIKFTAEADGDTANVPWNEWGIYDQEPSETENKGILFNHRYESMGTKAQGSIWVVEVTINLLRS